MIALSGGVSTSLAMEMSAPFEPKASEETKSIGELFKIFPKEILNIIVDFSDLAGNNRFLNELARQLELADVYYDKIVQEYSDTHLAYCPIEKDISALLKSNFKTNTLTNGVYQRKIKEAFARYISSPDFIQLRRFIESKDSKAARKLILNIFLNVQDMAQDQPDDYYSNILASPNLKLLPENLLSAIRLMKYYQRVIESGKGYHLYALAQYVETKGAKYAGGCIMVSFVTMSFLAVILYCFTDIDILSSTKFLKKILLHPLLISIIIATSLGTWRLNAHYKNQASLIELNYTLKKFLRVVNRIQDQIIQSQRPHAD
jgi:hypothetical protein